MNVLRIAVACALLGAAVALILRSDSTVALAGPEWDESDDPPGPDVVVHPVELVPWIRWAGCPDDQGQRASYWMRMSSYEHGVPELIPEICVLQCSEADPQVRPLLLLCGGDWSLVTWAQPVALEHRPRGWEPDDCARATFSIVPGSLVWPCECFSAYCDGDARIADEDGIEQLERLQLVRYLDRLAVESGTDHLRDMLIDGLDP